MLTNDTPIATPEDDQFGVDPFAQALAQAISQMPSPKGVVIAVNGLWGCGKSSAVNLVVFHLDELIKQEKLKLIRFSPWWLSGTDAITAAFFSDLENAIGRPVGKQALEAIQKFTRRVLRFGKAAGTAADLYAPGSSAALGGVTEAVESLLPDEDDIEAQHEKISALLEKAEHFPTYFRFALGEELLPTKTISELVSRANDRDFILTTLRQALSKTLKSGRTRASVYLDELTLHASEVAEENIGPLVTALFEIADELDVKADEGRGMLVMSNSNLRLHWLLNQLVRDRVTQEARTPLLREAMKTASLYWYCNFAESCYSDHFPAEHQRHTPDDERWVDEKAAKQFHKNALTRIRSAAADGSIAQQRRLVTILYEWVRFSPKGIKEVKAKVGKLLANDEFVAHLAIDAFRITWSQEMGFGGMGDLVSRGTPQINKEAIRYFADEKKFMKRVRERQAAAIEPGEVLFWKTFIEASERPETDRFGRQQ